GEVTVNGFIDDVGEHAVDASTRLSRYAICTCPQSVGAQAQRQFRLRLVGVVGQCDGAVLTVREDDGRARFHPDSLRRAGYVDIQRAAARFADGRGIRVEAVLQLREENVAVR